MGNLLIVTLWELLGDAVAGLKWAGALLGARGEVLPMSSVPLTIEGQVRVPRPGRRVRHADHHAARPSAPVAGSLENVRLLARERAGLHRGADGDRAGRLGDPGPGLLVHLRAAAPAAAGDARRPSCNTAARRCLTMNLAIDTKETSGMSAADHLRVLRDYAPEFSDRRRPGRPGVGADLAEFRARRPG